MSCPMGFTSLDGPNPHLHQNTSHATQLDAVEERRQPPQSDGRIPPPLPIRPNNKRSNEKIPRWHQTKVEQGPIPFWASLISAWYNQLWGIGRCIIFTFFILALTPFLHIGWLFSIFLPERITILQPTFGRYISLPIFRSIQFLYTGLIVCIFESIGNTRMMLSGKVGNVFWDRSSVSAVTDVGGVGRADVTIFVSNLTSYTCFMDAIAFFSIAYRRKAMSNLYFLPIDMEGWSFVTRLLYAIFLAPLTVDSNRTLDLLIGTYRQPCSFVWFPEATRSNDEIAHTTTSQHDMAYTDELLHVEPPRLSHLFVHIVALTIASPSCGRLDLIDCTLAYTGSILADLEQEAASSTPDGALDYDEEDEFDAAASAAGGEPIRDDDSMDGYSADTININAAGGLLTRKKRKFEPTIPVFFTAAPLRQLSIDSNGGVTHLNGRSSSTSFPRPSASPKSRAALVRERCVPSFFAFLSGNAPSQIHVLLNQYDTAYINSRILHRPATTTDSTSSKPLHLTPAEEDSSRSSLIATLAMWLQQRFLHQEQQLSLFAVHACYHLLPSSLSASSIPISRPLDWYMIPVSGIRLTSYIAIDWIIIILSTIIMRSGRDYCQTITKQITDTIMR